MNPIWSYIYIIWYDDVYSEKKEEEEKERKESLKYRSSAHSMAAAYTYVRAELVGRMMSYITWKGVGGVRVRVRLRRYVVTKSLRHPRWR